MRNLRSTPLMMGLRWVGLSAMLFSTACGGGGDTNPSPPTTTSPVGSAVGVNITGSWNGLFATDRIPSTPLQLTLTNTDATSFRTFTGTVVLGNGGTGTVTGQFSGSNPVFTYTFTETTTNCTGTFTGVGIINADGTLKLLTINGTDCNGTHTSVTSTATLSSGGSSPGSVGGTWSGTFTDSQTTTPTNFTLNLIQSGQSFSGDVSVVGASGVGSIKGTMFGNTVTFEANGCDNDIIAGTGVVNGNSLSVSYDTMGCTNGKANLTRSSPQPTTSTTLFIGHDGHCGTVLGGTNGRLCPTNPIPLVNFSEWSSTSTINFSTTLSAPMSGNSYAIQAGLGSDQAAQAQAEIILIHNGVETVLYTSSVFNVSGSATYATFTSSGTGLSANGVSGDILTLRVRCSSGCGIIGGFPHYLYVLGAPESAQTTKITVPFTAVQ